jgi:acyl-CoA thioester hydrolase
MPHIDLSEIPSPSSFRHRIDLQMRFNDIDILGHLNNTVYFSLYDTGKAYYLEAVNMGKMNWQRVESVIANINCQFITPIYFGEPIEICTRCEHIGQKSITLFQMLVNKDTQEVKSICRSVMVAIDPDTKKSVGVPEKWHKGIRLYEEGLETPPPTLLKEKL